MPENEEGAYMREVREALRQRAPVSSGGEGVKLLYRCDSCSRVWLQDGAAPPRLDLSNSEIARLALELGAHVSELPLATCRICAAQGLGVIEIDQYQTGARLGGFGFSIEGVKPVGMHFLCAVLSMEWVETLREAPHARPVTQHKALRALVDWLAAMDMPAMYHSITRAEGEGMATTNPPGHGAPGTHNWLWRGADWAARCPALGGGYARVTLAQAMPPDEPYSFRLTYSAWRALCKQIQEGNIAGEPER